LAAVVRLRVVTQPALPVDSKSLKNSMSDRLTTQLQRHFKSLNPDASGVRIHQSARLITFFSHFPYHPHSLKELE
jgi:hypothetical protein